MEINFIHFSQFVNEVKKEKIKSPQNEICA